MTYRSSVASIRIGIVAIACGVSACSSTTAVEEVAGFYSASTFTVSGTTSGDVLAAGGSLTMTLSAGVVMGQLSVPASVGGPLQADLSGTYVVSGDTVWFAQEADTFVRDLPWIIGIDQLTGSATFSGTTVDVVLDRIGDQL